MANDEYSKRLLKNQYLKPEQLDALRSLRERIETHIAPLDGSPRFYYAGSYGKKTMIRENFDLDIVAYWPQDTKFTIKWIYDGVGTQLKKHWKIVNSKNVSWTLPFQGGFHIDVVPGRALDWQYREANLHRSDTCTMLKTSLKTHIDTVRGSGRVDAIRLMKLWRHRNPVPFKKSFLIEMMTINGCSGLRFAPIEPQLIAALRYVRDNIERRNIIDPANSNNSLSDDLIQVQRQQIKLAAERASAATSWVTVFGE
jgi:hypothetical protein